MSANSSHVIWRAILFHCIPSTHKEGQTRRASSHEFAPILRNFRRLPAPIRNLIRGSNLSADFGSWRRGAESEGGVEFSLARKGAADSRWAPRLQLASCIVIIMQIELRLMRKYECERARFCVVFRPEFNFHQHVRIEYVACLFVC